MFRFRIINAFVLHVRICMMVTTSQITNTHTHTHTHTCCSRPLTQEVHTLTSDDGLPSDMTSEDGSTLNAIGHALIQMQQGGQTTPSSQFLITRSTSSGSESGQKLMVNKEDQIYQCDDCFFAKSKSYNPR